MSSTLFRIPGQVLTASTATLMYTAPSSGTTPSSTAFQFLMLNTSGSTVNWWLWRVPNGGTVPILSSDVPQHLIVANQPLLAGERQSLDDKTTFQGGDMLYVLANGSGVTATGSVAGLF
jgi:hypothetical protein